MESTLLHCSRMASKDFTDASGMNWRVWNTVPISGAVINPGFEKGWLTFESDSGSLRRLAPIPAATLPWILPQLDSTEVRQVLVDSGAARRRAGGLDPAHVPKREVVT